MHLQYATENMRAFMWRQEEFSVPESAGKLPRWAVRIAELRKKLGMNQAEFAKSLGAGQGNVSKWETGKNRPTPDTFALMAKIAPDVDKFYFLDEAGIPRELFMGGVERVLPSQLIEAASHMVSEAWSGVRGGGGPKAEAVDMLMVPMLADPAAAGNPLSINERDIKFLFPMPAELLPPNSHIFGVAVEGDSMTPMLREGDIVLLDVKQRDAKKLNECMIAARVGDGVTIKYLRKNGKFYQLVPQNTSPRHEIRILTEDDDWSIIGKVVWRMGPPPEPPRRGKR
jgi:SOS-response transcriptional repressor LexA